MSEGERPKTRMRHVMRAATAVALLAAVAFAGAIVGRAWGTSGVGPPPPQVATLEAMQTGLTWVADKMKPSVVFVEAEGKVEPQGYETVPMPGMPEIPDPWREFFFGPGGPPGRDEQPERPLPRPPIGQGSGVVIDPAGYILTNNHVVGDAARVTVRFENGESYQAEVKGSDKLTDLAVIKIEPKHPLVAATLGDADLVKVGALAIAVGYPFGGSPAGGRFDEAMRFEPTITLGVISATNRQIASGIPGRPFRDLLQTDAPINPGSSGGPLVNVRGEVIGINQAIFTSGFTMGNIGVGFAIPINGPNKEVIEQIKGGEPVVRGRIGVAIEAVTAPIKHDYGVDGGVFVNEVEKDSPAEKAGVKAEDVIVSFNGKKITSSDDFVSMVQATKPGKTVDMEVVRAGKRIPLKVTVEALTAEQMARKPAEPEAKKLGLTVESLSDEVKGATGLSGGVQVKAIDPVSDGARAGLRPGDIIVKIGGKPVNDMETYRKAVANLKKGEPLTIRVWRQGHYFTAQIESLSE